MTIDKATIRQVWDRNAKGVFTIVVRRESDGERIVTWTRDPWLASLVERYADASGRPTVTVLFNETSHELTSVALQVAA